nr:protein S-acyltransferase 10-like [Ipomoea batatas]GMD36258.1 protein S-acyltransferase 10-like [Ipomoea batatas]
MGALCGFRDTWDRFSDRCFGLFPCLSDPARRATLGLKVALVMLHVVYAGVLFIINKDLVEKTRQEPWYTAMYLSLFIVTLAQYFITSGSSPGYVLDAMRAVNEAGALSNRMSVASKQPASSKNGSVVITIDQSKVGRDLLDSNATSWTKLVMDMYPHGTSVRTVTCTYCNALQPPRTKHCQDCDKCVLQFDHHCVWLGTCIGQGNHCKFWWYISEETALSIWTGILYIQYLKSNISKPWWIYTFVILLLAVLFICLVFLLLLLLFHSYLVLTNQTTYELVRRRRIQYLRGIPERVFPFSKGACRNLYDFCCAPSNIYRMEPLPTAREIEEKSRPYTCFDILSCRCCC